MKLRLFANFSLDPNGRRAIPIRRRAGRLVMTGGFCLLAPALVNAQTQTDPDDDTRDRKMGERLVRQARTDAEEDVMDQLMRLMQMAGRRLDENFDPGEKTQALQQDILNRLDSAIAEAAAQRSSGKRVKMKARGERRRMGQPDADRAQSGQKTGATADADDNAQPANAPSKIIGEDGQPRSFDVRRAWGHLPERERDEVIQGRDEDFLEAYRAWIERYYRALQESDEE